MLAANITALMQEERSLRMRSNLLVGLSCFSPFSF